MIDIKQEQLNPIPNEVLLRVIQLKEIIAKQNALIIQALSLPAMLVKQEKNFD